MKKNSKNLFKLIRRKINSSSDPYPHSFTNIQFLYATNSKGQSNICLKGKNISIELLKYNYIDYKSLKHKLQFDNHKI